MLNRLPRGIKEIEGYRPFVKALKIILVENAIITLMITIKKSGSHDLIVFPCKLFIIFTCF